jgi:hypothetical protein
MRINIRNWALSLPQIISALTTEFLCISIISLAFWAFHFLPPFFEGKCHMEQLEIYI